MNMSMHLHEATIPFGVWRRTLEHGRIRASSWSAKSPSATGCSAVPVSASHVWIFMGAGKDPFGAGSIEPTLLGMMFGVLSHSLEKS